MVRSIFLVRDPAVRPSVGQQLMLEHGVYRTRGVVRSFSGDSLLVTPETSIFLRQLRPGSRLKAQVMTRNGTLEVTANLISCHDVYVALQMVGQPRLLQRRGQARAAVRVDATLSWLTPHTGALLQVQGHTQNLSMGGALMRFPGVTGRLPQDDAVTLLGLWIPSGGRQVAVSAAVNAVQVWDTGARLHFVGLRPDEKELLGTYLEPLLT